LEKEKIKSTFFEFLRYVLVGGLSALIDMGVNYAMLYYIFRSDKNDIFAVVVSVAVGFAVGLAVNFILSNFFVFRTAEQRSKGQTVGAFVIYTVVGVIGFGITEGLTVLGTNYIGEEGIWYILLTCIVKGIVLVWNYIGRKVFVYRGK
jgi:putative flippase GtrA